MKRDRRPPLKLPEGLREQLRDNRYKHIWRGDITDVYRFTGPEASKNYYLKRHRRRSNHNALKERDVINWLQGKLPVAENAGHGKDRDHYYMLLKELPGIPAHKLVRKIPAERMLAIMVRIMKRMHSVPIRDCPFDETMVAKLGRIRYSIDHGYVRKDIYNRTSPRKAEKDFDYLVKNIPAKENLVFTHGDFCLPNFLLTGEKLTGVVDLADAGVGDRYISIELQDRAIRS